MHSFSGEDKDCVGGKKISLVDSSKADDRMKIHIREEYITHSKTAESITTQIADKDY